MLYQKWVPEWVIDLMNERENQAIIDESFHHCPQCNGLSQHDERGCVWCRTKTVLQEQRLTVVK